MISYSLDKNTLIVTFKDDIHIKDIAKFLDEFSKLDGLPDNLNLLYDLLEVKITVSHDEIKQISNIANNSTNKYKSIRTAFLVSDPKLTAYSTLFSNLADSKTIRKIFSTKEAAIKWLEQKSV